MIKLPHALAALAFFPAVLVFAAEPGPVASLAAPAPVVPPALPTWAYPQPTPGAPRGAPDPGGLKHVPDSKAEFTRAQITGRGAPVADWHPEDHSPMPEIVAQPKTQLNLLSCGYCHLPTGAGRPENSSLAGLTPGYIRQQVLAFKNGDRPSSDPRRGPQTNMIAVAKATTDAELEQAAAYFASLKPATFIKVIEADTVPKTYTAGGILAKHPAGGTEPIGNRIIEVPEELERFELRDSRMPYVAYVPPGSIKRGEELVKTGGNGKTVQCTVCHGPDLRGLLDFPRLAGRSPSYLMRQLWDMKNGTRTGGTTILMKPTVVNLTEEDMVAIVAYLASREP
jgi:cytochrome c553